LFICQQKENHPVIAGIRAYQRLGKENQLIKAALAYRVHRHGSFAIISYRIVTKSFVPSLISLVLINID
jgi:hypothetical protein